MLINPTIGLNNYCVLLPKIIDGGYADSGHIMIFDGGYADTEESKISIDGGYDDIVTASNIIDGSNTKSSNRIVISGGDQTT